MKYLLCAVNVFIYQLLRVMMPARRGMRVHLEHGECEMENSKTES